VLVDDERGAITQMTIQAPPEAPCGGDHAVHFYEHEAELADRVGSLLGKALEDGDVAISIASEPHRREFEARLEDAGIDVGGALRNGRLLSLDAAASMAQFMQAGRIDARSFRRVIGGIVQEAGSTGRPVCAYGEMVALLWDAGDVLGAIELEELWNELGRDLRFTLLCGYPTDAVSRPEHAESLRRICGLHSEVVRPGEVSGRFAPEINSPRAARHLVADALRGWGCGDSMIANAELVCTELATNAVIHARTTFSVVARRTSAGVRISVHDASPLPPAVAHGVPARASGRGLQLVSLVASCWGFEMSRARKTVWADL
jgi:MEDS: MEthanogen/methylotroph, DcmR Sensory domain/Histidine kinase-like ATPase domain